MSNNPYRIPLPAILMTTFNNPNYFHYLIFGLIPLMLQDYFNNNNQNKQVLLLSSSKRKNWPNYIEEIFTLVAPEKKIYKSKSIGSTINSRFCLQQINSKVAVSELITKWWNKNLKANFQNHYF